LFDSIYTIRLRGGTRLELGQDGANGLWLKVCKNGEEHTRSELHPKLLVFLARKEGVQDDSACVRHGLMRPGSVTTWYALVKHQINRIEVQINDDEEDEE